MKPLVKIYVLAAAWVVLALVSFGYGFGTFNGGNTGSLRKLQEQDQTRRVLEADQKSFENASKQLKQLEDQPHKPDDLFSQDVTLVSEIKRMEAAAAKLDIRFTISGLSGTIKRANKAKGVQSDLLVFPYSITLNGRYADIITFVEMLEHMPFISHVSAFSVSATEPELVTASLSASFFLRK